MLFIKHFFYLSWLLLTVELALSDNLHYHTEINYDHPSWTFWLSIERLSGMIISDKGLKAHHQRTNMFHLSSFIFEFYFSFHFHFAFSKSAYSLYIEKWIFQRSLWSWLITQQPTPERPNGQNIALINFRGLHLDTFQIYTSSKYNIWQESQYSMKNFLYMWYVGTKLLRLKLWVLLLMVLKLTSSFLRLPTMLI